uniref:GPI ethanolamine phosphate transferase 1 n=1 Tax=Parastrongyloides trichosuri TaxID=131310 RepID=A0A0N4ZV57_PARTI
MKFLFSIIEVILHIILLFAPFTIYFTSPIVDVIRSHEISTHGLAKRLVIFSAGGVRENTFYQNLSSIVFLNKLIIEGKAMFGVGETHVPTDTRANYVALTSGLYENIIRMTFKTTPLSVDTIFDRAKKSVIFGNKNIVKLFEKNENIKVFSYIPDKKMFQNYENSTKWVFEKVKEFYKNEPFLMEENKIITFINLESTDIIGHVFKPTSKEYVNMLIEVDKNIFEMYQMIENIYPDKSTSYIFTSDHGMTDLGKHGGGSDHETQVPFVAWGAGIQPSRRKQRIKQIDIPSFLSSLIGTAIPKNNLGILPQHLLRSSPTYKYQASCGNLKQMVEQYLLQREQVYNHTLSIFFKEDSEFTQKTLSSLTKEVTRLAENRRYDTAAAILEHAAYFDSEFLNIQLISIPSPDDIIFGRFSTQEYQRAYIAMSLILVAFFDMQSISSLILCNVDTIPSFFKTFSPTIIYLLLIIKKIIPLLIVAIAFSGTLSRKAGTLYRFSVLIMIISDTIAFFMFFYLKDEGTLSEVGVALSNYIISITLSLFVYILLNIANFFMLSDCPNLRIFFNLQDPNIIEKNKETV